MWSSEAASGMRSLDCAVCFPAPKWSASCGVRESPAHAVLFSGFLIHGCGTRAQDTRLEGKAFLLLFVAKSCPTLCAPMDWSTPGFPVLHYIPEFAQTHVHWVSDAIQPSHPLSPPPCAFNLSQHQSLFQWVCFSHQVVKVLEFQLHHQSFQWIFRGDFL